MTSPPIAFSAVFLDSVEGSASSRLKLAGRAELPRKSSRMGLVAYVGFTSSLERYVESPSLRSAMSLSSAHADGMNDVTRMRFGGRVSGSLSDACRSANYSVRQIPVGDGYTWWVEPASE